MNVEEAKKILRAKKDIEIKELLKKIKIGSSSFRCSEMPTT
jgi:hypothetical protein